MLGSTEPFGLRKPWGLLVDLAEELPESGCSGCRCYLAAVVLRCTRMGTDAGPQRTLLGGQRHSRPSGPSASLSATRMNPSGRLIGSRAGWFSVGAPADDLVGKDLSTTLRQGKHVGVGDLLQAARRTDDGRRVLVHRSSAPGIRRIVRPGRMAARTSSSPRRLPSESRRATLRHPLPPPSAHPPDAIAQRPAREEYQHRLRRRFGPDGHCFVVPGRTIGDRTPNPSNQARSAGDRRADTPLAVLAEAHELGHNRSPGDSRRCASRARSALELAP
jgi:hypothetical protein